MSAFSVSDASVLLRYPSHDDQQVGPGHVVDPDGDELVAQVVEGVERRVHIPGREPAHEGHVLLAVPGIWMGSFSWGFSDPLPSSLGAGCGGSQPEG